MTVNHIIAIAIICLLFLILFSLRQRRTSQPPPQSDRPSSQSKETELIAANSGSNGVIAELVKLWTTYQPVDSGTGPTFGTMQSSRLNKSQYDVSREDVDVSAFAPPFIAPGQTFLLQIMLHRKADLVSSARLAVTTDGSANRRGFATLAIDISPGMSVEVFVDSPDCGIQQPVQSLIWQGTPASASFNMTLQSSISTDEFVSRVHISADGVALGEVNFSINVDRSSTNPVSTHSKPIKIFPAGQKASAYKKAFISYSRKDFDRVSLFAQGLEQRDIELCVDVNTFEPGDDWAEQIERNIQGADVFYLIWSKNAADSVWVLKEAERAIAIREQNNKSHPHIKPITLERPTPRPPEFLNSLHFDSTWLAHRAAQKIPLFDTKS